MMVVLGTSGTARASDAGEPGETSSNLDSNNGTAGLPVSLAPLPKVLSGTVELTATPLDSLVVAEVEYLVDGSTVGRATSAPWRAKFSTWSVENGPHTLEAIAWGPGGTLVRGETVTIVVDNEPLDEVHGAVGCASSRTAPLPFALILVACAAIALRSNRGSRSAS